MTKSFKVQAVPRGPAAERRRIIGSILGVLVATASPAFAQAVATRPPAVAGGEVAAPVEIAMSTVNGEVRCAPAQARQLARDMVDLRVVNRAEEPLWFVAPELFRSSDHIDSGGFTLDLVEGGFLVAPGRTVRVLMRTPKPDAYPYSCFEPGGVPRPESSGFLTLVPAVS